MWFNNNKKKASKEVFQTYISIVYNEDRGARWESSHWSNFKLSTHQYENENDLFNMEVNNAKIAVQHNPCLASTMSGLDSWYHQKNKQK